MEIKNLKTGNLIRFGGEHFKRLVKLQETTGVKYFTKKDLAGCVSANKKTITKTQQKVKKLGTNAKRKQKGGVLINDVTTMRKFPDRIDKYGVTHIGESSKTEMCMVCHEEWEVEDADGEKTKNLNLIAFRIDECGHEICTTCATQWFVSKGNITCPLCIVEVDVANLKKQIGIIEDKIEIREVFEAIRKNNLDKIKTYVEQGGDIHGILDTYEDEDGDGDTLLQIACQDKNNLEIVTYLVDNGADVNSKNNYGDTPLTEACSYGSLEIVKYLVDKKADVNPQDDEGDTPLTNACSYGSLEIVTYLVDNGADVNSKNIYGNTPLHNSIQKNSLQLVKYLVDQKADVNAKNKDNKTPLDLARQKGHNEIVDFFTNIKRGGGKFRTNKNKP